MPAVNRKAEGKHTQSVIFKKDCGWTKESSRSWLKEHKYFTDGHDETDNAHRWRQYDPDDKRFRYANEVIEKKGEKNSIILVLGFPKGSPKSEEAYSETSEEKTQNKETDMSLGKEIEKAVEKIKTLEADINEQKQQIADATAARDLAQKTLADASKKFDETSAAQKLENEKVIIVHTANIKTLEDEKIKLADELQNAQNELTAVKNLLANPAFKDAKAEGENKPLPDGGDATTAKGKLWDQYDKLKTENPVEATKFWNEHEADLKAEAREMFGKV